jgi:uncharacterized membrane protein YeaQ/YmgE (transglycosylase-associated protein family)
MEWIWFLAIGGVAGWLAGTVFRGKGFGILGNIVIGVVGALVGGFVFPKLGIHWQGDFGAFIMATLGAIILLALLSLTARKPMK